MIGSQQTDAGQASMDPRYGSGGRVGGLAGNANTIHKPRLEMVVNGIEGLIQELDRILQIGHDRVDTILGGRPTTPPTAAGGIHPTATSHIARLEAGIERLAYLTQNGAQSLINRLGEL